MRARLEMALIGFGLVGLLSCSGGENSTEPPTGGPDTTPASVTAVSGDDQTAEAGGTLAESLVVRVSNAAGEPLSAKTVAWTVEGGGGSLASSTSSTNAQGQATNAYTVGPNEGTNTIRATVQGTTLSTSFTATAEAPVVIDTVATELEIVKGNNQSAVVGEALADELAVVVRNAAGEPIAAKSVSWAVTAGGGELLQSEGTTNIAGEAANFYSVGSSAGVNTIEVTVTGNPTVMTTFTATATAPPSAAAVIVSDNQFVPDEVQLAVGGKVTWNWTGSNSHNVIWVAGGLANSSTQSAGTHQVTFPSSGTFDYYCSIHGTPTSGMRGKVDVKD